jgi:hypothetical protein
VYPRLWADPVYRSDAEELLTVCADRDVGVMAIKAAARRPWTGDHPTSPWYEPQTDPSALERGIAFALSTPGVHAFCTPGSIDLLPQVLDAAGAFRPLDPEAREAASAATVDDPLIFPIASAR